VVRFARENSGWGYDRVVRALANLRYQVSDQTVGNILRRHGMGLCRSGAEPPPGRTLFAGTWPFLLARTSLRRSADLARTGDVLCSIFHSSGQPTSLHRWNHRSSGCVLDASGGLQHDIEGDRTSEPLSLRFARSRCQVLRSVPRQVSTTSFAQSKLERFCGTQRAIGQRGVPLPADPVRESFVEESNH
jgi:hypothetical protein